MPSAENRNGQMQAKLVGRVLYPLWLKKNHPQYARYAKAFEQSQYLPAEKLQALQARLLREQIAHVYQHVPYYRERMRHLGIAPEDIYSLGDLLNFPILTKRDIQKHKDEMVARNIPERKRAQNQTGGSTGSPLQFWVDKERFDSRRASTDRHNAWAGLQPGDWYAVLWGSTFDAGTTPVAPLTWRERWLDRALTLNSSLMGQADLEKFVTLLRRYRPRFLKAYAQAAAMFARYCRNHAQDIKFDAIITSAEVLTPQDRTTIETAFGGRVFNRYGCREVSVIASECEAHSGMHVNADALIVEIQPTGDPLNPMGKVLVTDLYNRSMPLIRYEIGDLAQWAQPGRCPCGRSLPRIGEVAGRTTDFLALPNGSVVSGPSLALLIGQTPEVKQAQFVQTSPTSVSLRVVIASGYGAEAAQKLQDRLKPYLNGQLRLTIMPVDKIAAEPSGKYRFVKREF
jgi:phenylacetate-CoA ligase